MEWFLPMYRTKSKPASRNNNTVRKVLERGAIVEGVEKKDVLELCGQSPKTCRGLYEQLKKGVRSENGNQIRNSLQLTEFLSSNNTLFMSYTISGGLGMEVAELRQYEGDFDLICGDAKNAEIREIATRLHSKIEEATATHDPLQDTTHSHRIVSINGKLDLNESRCPSLWSYFFRPSKTNSYDIHESESERLQSLLQKESYSQLDAEHLIIFCSKNVDSSTRILQLLTSQLRSSAGSRFSLPKIIRIFEILQSLITLPETATHCLRERQLLLSFNNSDAAVFATDLCRSLNLIPSDSHQRLCITSP